MDTIPSTPTRNRRDSHIGAEPPSPLASIWQTDWKYTKADDLGFGSLNLDDQRTSRALPTPESVIWHTPTRADDLLMSPSYRGGQDRFYSYERYDQRSFDRSSTLSSLEDYRSPGRTVMTSPNFLPPSPPALSPGINHNRAMSYPNLPTPPPQALFRSNSTRSRDSQEHAGLLERLLEKGLTPQQIELALEKMIETSEFSPNRQAPALARSPPRLDRRSSQTHSPRSPVLEEYRNKNRKIELRDVVGHVVEFSTDQHGSRFIQQKIESASPAEKQFIFEEASKHTLQLTKDVFGNYVIQKLIELCTPAQRHALTLDLQGNVVDLSLQMYGCRVVQKAIEFGSPEDQAVLIGELKGNVLQCVRDQNGNHVIQKSIECARPEDVQFIIDSFQSHVYELATHPYGCRVLQRVFEFCPADQSKPLLEELHVHTLSLIQDQYGNYVAQHVLESGTEKDKDMVIGKIKGNVLRYSQHKFASNVVEKCIAQASSTNLQQLVQEVIGAGPDGISPLTIMIKDQYANYVVQKMLDVVDASQREVLLQHILPHVPALRKLNYGKHLITKVEKFSSV